MNDRMVETMARRVAANASRRRLMGGLVASLAAVVAGRVATAAPSPKAQPSPKAACMQGCTGAAKTCRQGTRGLRGKEKAAALKVCKTDFQTCRIGCTGEPDDDEDEEETPGS
jgi:hypothetical protein